jgi:hypothetical protein
VRTHDVDISHSGRENSEKTGAEQEGLGFALDVPLWADINVGNPNQRGAMMRRALLLVVFLFAVPALAGKDWYLLSPPKIPGVMEFDEKAPLKRWEQHGAFDSAEDCERNLDDWRVRAMDRSDSFLVSKTNI